MKPRRNEEAQAHIGLSSHRKKKLNVAVRSISDISLKTYTYIHTHVDLQLPGRRKCRLITVDDNRLRSNSRVFRSPLLVLKLKVRKRMPVRNFEQFNRIVQLFRRTLTTEGGSMLDTNLCFIFLHTFRSKYFSLP
jgi:hypothetical protein